MNTLSIIKDYKEQYIRSKSNLEEFLQDREVLKSKLNKHVEKLDELENIMFAAKLIIEKITYESKRKLEDFLTYALKNIFTDRDYEIKFNMRDDTKRPALELTLVEGGVEQEITDAVGGGIITTLGLLLQIYYIEAYNINRVVFIDEGLKEVSSARVSDDTENKSYLENLLAFLKWLAHEKRYKIVLVTHDNKVREYSDKVYEVRKGVVKEC